jgi:hypothetical protein
MGINMATKTDKILSGRAVPNEQGNVTWEWQTDITVDTVVVHSLGENLALEGVGSRLPGGGTNPYDQSSTVNSTEGTARRRTLDDMRLLSEDIKRSKHTTKK